MREQLHNHLSDFYKTAISTANQDPVKAYVFGATKDQAKVAELVRILNNHSITVNKLSNKINAAGTTFDPFRQLYSSIESARV